jgi:hypothetical protein
VPSYVAIVTYPYVQLFFWTGESFYLSFYSTITTMDGDEDWLGPDPLGLNLPDPDPLGLNLPDPDPLGLNWPDPDPFTTDPLAPDPFASDPFAPDPFEPDPFEPDPFDPDPFGPDPLDPDPFGLLADWPDLDPVADDLNNSEVQPVVVDGLNIFEVQPAAAKVEDSIGISRRLGLRRIRQPTDLTETEKALCDGLIQAMARANRDHVKSIEKARLGLWREVFPNWNTWLIPRRPGASILKSRNDCSDRIGHLIAPVPIRHGEPIPDSREAGSPVHIRRSVAKACFEYVDKHRCTVPETLVKWDELENRTKIFDEIRHKFDAEDAKRIGTYNKRLVVYWAQCRLFDLVRPDDPHPKLGRLDKDDTALIGQLVQPFVTTLEMATTFGLATQKRWPIVPISFER